MVELGRHALVLNGFEAEFGVFGVALDDGFVAVDDGGVVLERVLHGVELSGAEIDVIGDVGESGLDPGHDLFAFVVEVDLIEDEFIDVLDSFLHDFVEVVETG